MNKQDIFPLYVGKCRVKWLKAEHSKTYAYEGINYPQIFLELEGHHKSAIIPDCQLVLKRISDMDREFNAYYDNLLLHVSIECQKGIYKKANHAELQKAINDVQEFLIQNGYALNDEWFTNGIAVEEKTK